MKMISRSRWIAAAVVGWLAFALFGARAETPGPISEETPPAVCDPGAFVVEIHCSGDYCDDVAITCRRFAGATLGSALWLPWVSEEQRRADCPAGSFIAGLACHGKYCDDLSLYCVQVTNATTFGCSGTAVVSEENGGNLSFFSVTDKAGVEVAARAMSCSGSYCDNKTFDVCEVGVR
jgi:hypothetical protein